MNNNNNPLKNLKANAAQVSHSERSEESTQY